MKIPTLASISGYERKNKDMIIDKFEIINESSSILLIIWKSVTCQGRTLTCKI